MKTVKQTGGLDYFKLAAAFLVVAIHTSPLSSFSDAADFVLTRILARLAVPFFFMVTGYFTLGDRRPLRPALKKTLLLYLGAMLLYFPVNLYAGHFAGAGIGDVLRLLVFDGTYFHLWYLPALIMGLGLIWLLRRKLPDQYILALTLLLYSAGLMGDSYYGFIEAVPGISAVYGFGFSIFTYTRNGIFFAPVFLIMGALLREGKTSLSTGACAAGFVLSLLAMTGEGLLLHRLGVQRHDSMYVLLPLCMFFLYRLLLSVEVKPVKAFRPFSMWIYLIHPLMLLVVRGAARILHLTGLLVDNSLLHYTAVCTLSAGFAAILALLPGRLTNLPGRRRFQEGRAWIELDREALRQNVGKLRSLLKEGCQLMPVVKADAYGHGAALISRELNALGIRSFCVATVTEGILLRQKGVRGEILVLGYTHPEQFPLLRRYRLTQTVLDYPYARILNGFGKKITVHVKIDTGMHRLGVRCDSREDILRIFHCKNLRIKGVFTHLCAADSAGQEARAFTLAQGASFYKVVSRLQESGFSGFQTHLQASSGLLQYPELGGDYARTGIALYGLLSSRPAAGEDEGLRPVLSLKARVAGVKWLYQGESAGYGPDYTAVRDMKIAVIAIGYADGIPRALSQGRGNVLLHGKKAPVIGRICMDQMIVDVSDIPETVPGDAAVIIGRDGQLEITAYDLAQECGTITNEILSRLGARLERVLLP